MRFEGWNSAGWPLQNAASVWAEHEAEGATGSSPAKWECMSLHFEDQQPHSNVYGKWEEPGEGGQRPLCPQYWDARRKRPNHEGQVLFRRMKVIEGLCI